MLKINQEYHQTGLNEATNYDQEGGGDDGSSIIDSHQVMILRAQLSAYKSDESYSSYGREQDDESKNFTNAENSISPVQANSFASDSDFQTSGL